MNILSEFTPVIPNMYDFYSKEQKKKIFWEMCQCFLMIVHTMEVIQPKLFG